MTYKNYCDIIKQVLSGTTLNGNQYLMQAPEICLVDEIELSPSTTYPAAFITPVDNVYVEQGEKIEYNIRIYVAAQFNDDRTIRYEAYSNIVTFVNNFLLSLPTEYFWTEFPITLTPVLLWDNKVDGYYFDIKATASAGVCMSGEVSYTSAGVTVQFGSSGSSGTSGTDGKQGPSGIMLSASTVQEFELLLPYKLTYGRYMEYTKTDNNITQVNYWSNSGKTIPLFTKDISYSGTNPTQVVVTDQITGKILTKTITYNGNEVQNVKITIT